MAKYGVFHDFSGLFSKIFVMIFTFLNQYYIVGQFFYILKKNWFATFKNFTAE